MNLCAFHLLLQLISFGLASFHLGLIHHVVCGQAERIDERYSAKGTSTRLAFPDIALFSLAHAV